DMMPEGTKSVQDTFAIADRMGSITSLQIIAEAPDRSLAPEQKDSPVYNACVSEAQARWETEQAAIAAARSEDEGGEDDDEEKIDASIPDRAPDETFAHCNDGLILFARALTEALDEMELVGYVHYRNDKSFFQDNMLLYATVDELNQLYTDIDEKLDEARKQSGEWKACMATAFNPDEDCADLKPGAKKKNAEGEEEEEDGFSESALRKKYASRYDDSEINYSGEYFLDPLPDGAWIIKVKVR